MFYNELREGEIEKLNKAIKRYDKEINKLKNNYQILFDERLYSSNIVLVEIETYINKLANSPKDFDKSFLKLKLKYKNFKVLLEEFSTVNYKLSGTAIKIAAGGGIAIAAAGGSMASGSALFASLAGSSALFGSMASSSALLVLTGPIGVGVTAIGLIGGGMLKMNDNKKIAESAIKKCKSLIKLTYKLKSSNFEIIELLRKTREHNNGVKNALEVLSKDAPINYNDFTIEQKNLLGALINNINSLSVLINQSVK